MADEITLDRDIDEVLGLARTADSNVLGEKQAFEASAVEPEDEDDEDDEGSEGSEDGSGAEDDED